MTATIPIHADHINPSDFPAVMEVVRTSNVLNVTLADLPTATPVSVARWVAPCDGLIENVSVTCDVCGTVGNTDFDLQKDGTTMLAALINIDNADADPTTKFGTFTAATDAEVNKGEVLTVVVTKNSSPDGTGYHVNVDFVALGRA